MVTEAMSKADQTAADVLSAAIEGGTNYWAAVSKIERAEPGGEVAYLSVSYHEMNDDCDGYKEAGVTVDLAAVKAAMRKIAFEDVKHVSASTKATVRALIFEGSEEADYDADDADIIVQVAVLGEVVYG